MAFAIAYGALLVVSLVPSRSLPDLALSDKLEHFAAYAVLAVLGGKASARRRLLAAFLLVTGVSIEILQQAMGLGRQADPIDLLADVIGICCGLLLVAWLDRRTAPSIEERSG